MKMKNLISLGKSESCGGSAANTIVGLARLGYGNWFYR